MTPRSLILLVDDESRSSARWTPLALAWLDVDIAGTGADALRLFAAQPPDMIVLDLGLRI